MTLQQYFRLIGQQEAHSQDLIDKCGVEACQVALETGLITQTMQGHVKWIGPYITEDMARD